MLYVSTLTARVVLLFLCSDDRLGQVSRSVQVSFQSRGSHVARSERGVRCRAGAERASLERWVIGCQAFGFALVGLVFVEGGGRLALGLRSRRVEGGVRQWSETGLIKLVQSPAAGRLAIK